MKIRTDPVSVEEVFRRLLELLPLNAEDGSLREEIEEYELISSLIDSSGAESAGIAISLVRRVFLSLALLDKAKLAIGKWAFVSFPASLLARSFLATLATKDASFVPPDYWLQGTGRPEGLEDEQRALLKRLETERVATSGTNAVPIRTVHVTWGLIRLGSRYLMHRREDKARPDVSGYVFPGGRLDLADLPTEKIIPESLRDLFSIDSTLAKSAQLRTLSREMKEELGLLADDFSENHLVNLKPFKKIEGARNNHVLSQWSIVLYSVKLSRSGETKVLSAAAERADDWSWFSPDDLIRGARSDGSQAFLDAINADPAIDPEAFFTSMVPESSSNPPIFRGKGDAIELPPEPSMPILKGEAGKQKAIDFEFDQAGWELLMLLGWHTRGLPVVSKNGAFQQLGGGWLKLRDGDLRNTASVLAKRMAEFSIPLLECDSQGHCRLSIEANLMYFQPNCFTYHWDIESEEKPIVLTLRGLETRCGALKQQQRTIRLSPAMVKAMDPLEKGKEPDIDSETIAREFRRLMAPADAVGLRQFIVKRSVSQEIAVPKEQSPR